MYDDDVWDYDDDYNKSWRLKLLCFGFVTKRQKAESEAQKVIKPCVYY